MLRRDEDPGDKDIWEGWRMLGEAKDSDEG